MNVQLIKSAVPILLLAFSTGVYADVSVTEKQQADAAITTAKADESASEKQAMLKSKVQQTIDADQNLKEAQIETAISSDGAVLLSGTVNTPEERQLAEELVASVDGVTQVQNELRVPRGE